MQNNHPHGFSAILAAVLVCMLTAALLVPLFASAGNTVTGTPTASVRLRSEPSTVNTKTLQTLGKTDKVTVLSKGTGADGKLWYRVNYGSMKGYILGKYLNVSNAKDLKTETYSWKGKAKSKPTATPKPKNNSKTTSGKTTSKPTATPKPSGPVTEELDWFAKGVKIFGKNGLKFQLKDVNSGKIVNCKSRKASNHLDAEPASADDTKTLLGIYGGKFNYKRHPVLVKYNGHVYAGSMYCEPHGEGSVGNNNFDGHFCIHFTGSKTHDTKVVNDEHQKAIKKALKSKW